MFYIHIYKNELFCFKLISQTNILFSLIKLFQLFWREFILIILTYIYLIIS